MFFVDKEWSALILGFVCLFCWGSWPNTSKLSQKKVHTKKLWLTSSKEVRFEVFYCDYSLGAFILTAIYAFSLGMISYRGNDVTFIDNLKEAGAAQILYAFAAGTLFNFSYVLFIAAIHMTGISIAGPIWAGV